MYGFSPLSCYWFLVQFDGELTSKGGEFFMFRFGPDLLSIFRDGLVLLSIRPRCSPPTLNTMVLDLSEEEKASIERQ